MIGESIPAALSTVFDRLMLCSLQAGLGIVLVLAIRAALGKRLHGQWLYVLWLIVMLRLALPWVPETRWSPVSLSISMRHDSAVESAASPPRSAAPAAAGASPVVSNAMPSDGMPSFSGRSASLPMSVSARPTPPPWSTWSMRHCLYAVWLTGIVGFGVFIGVGVLYFRYRIVRERPVTASSVLELLED